MTRILVLNFFPAFIPPSSGGELRYFNLYNELSRDFDITLLSPTYSHHSSELIKHSASFREYRVPKEPIHDILHRDVGRQQISPEVSGLVCALSARYPNNYHRTYLELYPSADIIIHEFPYMLEYDLFFGIDKKPRIYNSHNVESSLIRQIWHGANASQYIDYVRLLESRLVTESDLCFAVSEEEKERFIRDFHADPQKMAVAPNGINPVGNARAVRVGTKKKRPSALFFGSFHPPNIAAAEFIINELADQCPDVDFLIAGACISTDRKATKSNVKVLGKVSDQVKETLLADADLAVNPMFTGAGTNLKILEYLSHGIPTVSTKLGSRGLNFVADEHCIIANKDNFAAKLRELAGDKDRLERVSEQGKAFVENNYSWNSIASHVGAKIKSTIVSNQRHRKKTLFVLNDFEVNSPSSGGEIRINRICTHLSHKYEVVLLCLNNVGLISRTDITGSFVQLSLPKTEEHLRKEIEINSSWGISASDIIASMFASQNDLVGSVFNALYQNCDAVIVEHPYMVGLLNGKEEKPLVYESHNCEYDLKRSMLEGHPHYAKLMEAVKSCEAQALAKSTFVISVSDNDHGSLRKLCQSEKTIYTIPHGVDFGKGYFARQEFPEIVRMFHGHPVIVFIGSGHKPNLDCVEFIKDQLAPAMPKCFFMIVGSACDTFVNRVPRNMLLCGKVDEESKKVLMSLATVAVNPVASGSGSNLKLAEYLAEKIPVVTTPFGARGYAIESGKEAIVCELADFQSEIRRLLENVELQRALAERGYRYAKSHLDWGHLACRYDRVLQRELFQSSQKRLLVVTYRFTDPPLGGAEVHLIELLRQIEKTGDFEIDVATLDIKTVTNQFHFSCSYSHDMEGPVPSDLAWTRVYRFKTDCLPDREKLSNARVLFRQWMQESRESSLRHLAKYPFAMLLGGWNYPESTRSGCEIWASDEALVFVPEAEVLNLRGFHPNKTKLTCFADQEIFYEDVVKGEFEIKLSPPGHSVLKFLVHNLVQSDRDPRILGIRVRSLSYEIGGRVFTLLLDYDYKTHLKRNFIDVYINELIHIAESRPQEFDDLFQRTRGPLSQALEEWLDQNVRNYDLVFGHGIPFATSVLATRYAKKYGKPVILMPHYHIDDEFYHWKSYYDALRQADDVIAFPRAASGLFFDKIKSKSSYLPLGIHLNEKPSPEDDLTFKDLYHSELPYVLVLGRKDRAKNYHYVIEAVKAINSKGRICKAVLVGRDEDGTTLDPDEVLYLGGQPRGVVLSAIRNSLCLISMSESESFGIVILEAWARRRPVIVSRNCIAYTEIVDDGVNGLYASKENLHEKIVCLLYDRTLAQRMGEHGYQGVLSTFTWSAISKELTMILEGLAYSTKRDPYQDERQEFLTYPPTLTGSDA
jgi:glycosyltransferase involved in cell wall biosynthesis